MAKRTTNKSELIRQYMAKHQNASAADIAKALKVQVGLVYQVKANLKAKKSKRKTAKRKVRTVASTDTSITQVVAAANLIKSCGSIEQAQQALKAAEKVAKALES